MTNRGHASLVALLFVGGVSMVVIGAPTSSTGLAFTGPATGPATPHSARTDPEEVREILDAYCRMLMLARGLGKVNYFSETEERDLLKLKKQWGFTDPRNEKEMENCDICANDVFRDSWTEGGIEQRAFEPPPSMRPGASSGSGAPASTAPEINQEQLIKTITDRVMAALQGK